MRIFSNHLRSILTALILSIFCIEPAIPLQDFCQRTSGWMKCLEGSKIFTIAANGHFFMQAMYGEYLKFTCMNGSRATLLKFNEVMPPNIFMGDASKFFIYNCPSNITADWIDSLTNILNLSIRNVTKLTLSGLSGSEKMQAVFAKIKEFHSVKELELEHLELESFKLDHATESLQLKGLEIKHCSIKSFDLESDALENFTLDNFDETDDFILELRNLKKLVFSNVNLKAFNSTSLRSLSSLSLDNSNISSSIKAVVGNLPELTIFTVMHSNISHISDHTFANNSRLIEISWTSNRVPLTLEPLALQNIPSLEKLFFRSSQIIELPDFLLAGNINLTTLSFADNQIKSLPKNLLFGLVSLKKLDLSENLFLSQIPSAFFIGAPNLLQLDMSKCNLRKLERDTFKGLKMLTSVNMAFNQISLIHSEAFNSNNIFRTLTEINLSHNIIQFSEYDTYFVFSSLNRLKILNLSHNKIRYMFAHLTRGFNTEFIDLEQLDLSHNRIEYFDFYDFFGSKLNTSRLTLKFNDNRIQHVSFLQKFHDFIAPNTTATIDLSRNNFTCDCNIVHLMRHWNTSTIQLKNIDEISCIHPESNETRTVVEMNPKDFVCPCTGFFAERDTRSFAELQTRLENCTSCQIRPWDNTIMLTFHDLRDLPRFDYNDSWMVEIDVRHNSLQQLEIPNRPEYLHVTKILAQNNNISHIVSLTRKVTKNLSELRLDNNRIAFLSEHVIADLSDLTNVTLGNNSFACNCSVANIIKLVDANIVSKINLTCSDPKKIMHHLNPAVLCHVDPIIVIASSVSAVFLAFIILPMLLFIRFKLEIRILLHHLKLRLFRNYTRGRGQKYAYDAFISFSEEDYDFVRENILKKLQNPPHSYKICSTYGDFYLGENRITTISRMVTESARTIVVMSPAFLNSCWNNMELRTAVCTAFERGRAPVIVIMYKNVKVTTDLDKEMQAYLRTKTYIRYSDHLFWKRLLYVLPHKAAETLDEESVLV